MSTTDAADFRTETISNPRGWAAVRVTHVPSSIVAERSRSGSLRSAVQAQRECIDELKELLGSGGGGEAMTVSADDAVSRAEFERLSARVEQLERQLDGSS